MGTVNKNVHTALSVPFLHGSCLISLTFYLFLVILGLDPGIHLPMRVSMDAASSAA